MSMSCRESGIDGLHGNGPVKNRQGAWKEDSDSRAVLWLFR